MAICVNRSVISNPAKTNCHFEQSEKSAFALHRQQQISPCGRNDNNI